METQYWKDLPVEEKLKAMTSARNSVNDQLVDQFAQKYEIFNALAALTDAEDVFSCIPVGPERTELQRIYDLRWTEKEE